MRSALTFSPFEATDLNTAYAKYKHALTAVIEDTFGWNEEFQLERFRTRYELSWFQWIEINQVRVGYICYWKNSSELHISLLIIDSDKRSLGYGRYAMDRLHAEARASGCKVTLSSFRKNRSAIRFYEGLGYEVRGGDEHFVDMFLSAR